MWYIFEVNKDKCCMEISSTKLVNDLIMVFHFLVHVAWVIHFHCDRYKLTERSSCLIISRAYGVYKPLII